MESETGYQARVVGHDDECRVAASAPPEMRDDMTDAEFYAAAEERSRVFEEADAVSATHTVVAAVLAGRLPAWAFAELEAAVGARRKMMIEKAASGLEAVGGRLKELGAAKA